GSSLSMRDCRALRLAHEAPSKGAKTAKAAAALIREFDGRVGHPAMKKLTISSSAPALALLDGTCRRFFIDGSWVEPSGQDRLAVVDPATETAFAEIAAGGPEDVDRAVAAARRAFPAFAATPLAQRCELLDRIHGLILERAEQFAEVLTREMGAASAHARAAHVPFAAEHVRAARQAAVRYPFETLRGATAILQEPIGVCGLITPWNWPLYQITAKVAA